MTITSIIICIAAKNINTTYNFANQESFEIAEIVDFHMNLWNEGKIDIALTSIVAVEEKLKAQGIRCLKMPIPQKNVELALQEAETLGRLHISQTAEIVIGFVKVKNIEELRDQWMSFKSKSYSYHFIKSYFGVLMKWIYRYIVEVINSLFLERKVV